MDTNYIPNNRYGDSSSQRGYDNAVDTSNAAAFVPSVQQTASANSSGGPEGYDALEYGAPSDNSRGHSNQSASAGPATVDQGVGAHESQTFIQHSSDMPDNMSLELARLRRLQIARQGSLPSQLPPMPSSPGHPYVYNEDTGLLSPTGRGLGEAGSRERRQYVEDHRTGQFRRVDQPSRFSFFKRGKRSQQQQQQQWQDATARQPGARLKAVADTVANIGGVIAMVVQGTLGGLALLNILMIYIIGLPDWGGDLTNFLEYYGPLGMGLNRLYYAFITISLIAACTRQANHAICSYEPKQLKLRRQDILLIVLYLAAYIISILCTPMDDELTYAYNRDHKFWKTQPLSSKFISRLKLWHLMNFVRIALCAIAWIVVSYQMRPLACDAVIASKVQAQMQELLGSRQGAQGSGSPYRLNAQHKRDVLPPAAADAPNLGSPPIRTAPDLLDDVTHGNLTRQQLAVREWSSPRAPLSAGRPGLASS